MASRWMAGLSRLSTRDLEFGSNQVPRCRLAQPFARGKWHSVALRFSQWRGVEREALAEYQQQVGQPLERRRLNTTLDASWLVLARSASLRWLMPCRSLASRSNIAALELHRIRC
jgi:hypothetical protein